MSRNILQKINEVVRNKTSLQQWRETKKVIDWFQGIANKNKCKFLKFDIVDFYPSISKDILLKSIDFAKKYSKITKKEIDIILHSRKTLLFDGEETRSKNSTNDLFDVTMGSNDSSEIAELVGLY